MTDLKILFGQITEKYGKNKDYPVPDIMWSDCNYYSALGEYQYINNRIIISRLLNSSQLPEEAVKAVIYHEYTHQLIAEHNEEFNKQMNRFPRYRELEKQINNYLDTCEFPPADARNDLMLSEDEETVITSLYFGDNPENYGNFIYFFDGCSTGLLERNIPVKYDKKTLPQVIFTVEANDMAFAVGWAKNVKVYSSDKRIDVSRDFDIDPLTYQFKCDNDNARWLKKHSVFVIEQSCLMPNAFKRSRICKLSDFSADAAKEIIDCINDYDGEFITYGMTSDYIKTDSPILSDDSNYIRSLAERETLNRALWLMNKAVALEPSYENYRARAIIHERLSNLEHCAEDLKKCIALTDDNNTVRTINSKISKLQKAHVLFYND